MAILDGHSEMRTYHDLSDIGISLNEALLEHLQRAISKQFTPYRGVIYGKILTSLWDSDKAYVDMADDMIDVSRGN